MKLLPKIPRTLALTLIFALALIYPLLWLKMLADPAQRTGADFIAFYAAGRIAREEGAAQVYDLRLQQKYEREALGVDFDFAETNPFVHPPFVIPLTQFSVTENYVASFQRWALWMIAFFAAGLPLLMKTLALPRRDIPPVAAALFLFFPSFQSIILGQDNALMFLGLAFLLWGGAQNKDWAAGLGLALTLIRPHHALFLLAPFLFQRRAALKWFALFAVALGLFSLAVVGIDGTAGFLKILTVSGSGEGFKINEEAMINLIGLLRRALPNLPASATRLAGWLAYGAALFAALIYAQRSAAPLEDKISLSAVAAIFFSPHSHVQDLLLLLAPILVLMRILLAKRILLPSRAALLPAGISFILLFSYASTALTHSLPYLLMAGLPFLILRYRP